MLLQSIVNGVGKRKIMLEKLLLAVTITFSLNLFLQVRKPDQINTIPSDQLSKTPVQILVTMSK